MLKSCSLEYLKLCKIIQHFVSIPTRLAMLGILYEILQKFADTCKHETMLWIQLEKCGGLFFLVNAYSRTIKVGPPLARRLYHQSWQCDRRWRDVNVSESLRVLHPLLHFAQVLTVSEFCPLAAFVTSQEINLAAFVVEVMKNVKFS